MEKKQMTSFEIDPELWLKFEMKRLEDINPQEKYGSMNKSRILNNLIEQVVDGKIKLDLVTPIKVENKITKTVHLFPEVKYKLDDFLLKERKKYLSDSDTAKHVDKIKTVIIRLLEWYVK